MRPSLNDLLTDAASRLRAAGVENARHDAEELLCRACGLEDRSALFLNNDGKAEPALLSVFSSYIERRAAGEPLQYIMGEAWFYGRRFAVRPGALIPRPETELLAERAVARLRDTERRVMDLCTGSGAIAVTLALECPEARVTATDVSEAALACARENAAALGATEQIEFLHGDLFAALDFQAASCRPFDLIVCNPPYIPTGVIDTL
ncbi:MAG: peptide chain release factor N(5)-glutamine methyltransferase, partial [Clostridiales Family XIII bacterium]|nr:peptide chain release factor N(5)-glutamine methyltransferase [Clostridiales Family XIII bacterium]